VVKKDRFSEKTVQVLELVQKKFLKNKCRNNSIILFTNCPRNWVSKQNDGNVKRALSQCNNQYHEYFLKFDSQDDDEDSRRKNKNNREKSVQALMEYLDRLQFDEIDLSYVQSNDLKNVFLKKVLPLSLVLLFFAGLPFFRRIFLFSSKKFFPFE
jgi:aryl-alcohol dehydrogenase-like predicted oxidoreductase